MKLACFSNGKTESYGILEDATIIDVPLLAKMLGRSFPQTLEAWIQKESVEEINMAHVVQSASRAEIEKTSKMTINGIIGNANLIEETSVHDIYSGYDFVNALSDESRLPLEFITASVELLPEIDMGRFSCPVLPIARQLVPPWLKAVDFGISDP